MALDTHLADKYVVKRTKKLSKAYNQGVVGAALTIFIDNRLESSDHGINFSIFRASNTFRKSFNTYGSRLSLAYCDGSRADS
jgi:hypothetical protein